MTQHEEAELLRQYQGLIFGIVRRYASSCANPVFDMGDLYAEAKLAFLVEARKLDDPRQVIMKRFEIQNAITEFVVRSFPVSVPYGSVHYIENVGLYLGAASLNELAEQGEEYEPVCFPIEDVLTSVAEEVILERLSPLHRDVLELLKDGYSRQEIASRLDITARQTRRRIEEIQDAFFEDFTPW